MEGPTPVSALIHAATMVTAGVYLLVRAAPIFESAPRIQDLAAGLGAATLLLAGLIALVQVDIKRVIAYSTMSQIGYMFLGAGIGRVRELDVPPDDARVLQGAALPRRRASSSTRSSASRTCGRWAGCASTCRGRTGAFLIGALALTGIPPLSGFFSKDAILASALAAGWYGQLLFVVGHRGRVPHRPLHVPDGLHRVRRRAVGATRASICTGPSAPSRGSGWPGPSACLPCSP